MNEKLEKKVRSITLKEFKYLDRVSGLLYDIEKRIQSGKLEKADKLVDIAKKQLANYYKHEKKINKRKYAHADKSAADSLSVMSGELEKKIDDYAAMFGPARENVPDNNLSEKDEEKAEKETKKFNKYKIKVDRLYLKMMSEVHDAYSMVDNKMKRSQWERVHKKLNKATGRLLAYKGHVMKNFDMSIKEQSDYINSKSLLFIQLSNITSVLNSKYNEFVNNSLEIIQNQDRNNDEERLPNVEEDTNDLSHEELDSHLADIEENAEDLQENDTFDHEHNDTNDFNYIPNESSEINDDEEIQNSEEDLDVGRHR